MGVGLLFKKVKEDHNKMFWLCIKSCLIIAIIILMIWLVKEIITAPFKDGEY